MADDKSVSLINLGKLSEPAVVLIEKVSDAVGHAFEPWHIKRVAAANAEADLIKAKTGIEISDLESRAMHRLLIEEAKRQNNMEKITTKAFPQLDDQADPRLMNDDWITNFFDKSRIVSDPEMQDLWANILAGEANSAGTYSKKTINLLNDLDKSDAELFVSLCRFGWNIEHKFSPLVFDHTESIYNDLGIDFEALSHLDSLGLITFSNVKGVGLSNVVNYPHLNYHGKPLVLLPKNKELDIGQVFLTRAGDELATVCKPKKVDGFFDYVKKYWGEIVSYK